MPIDFNNLNPGNIGDRRVKGGAAGALEGSDTAAAASRSAKAPDDEVQLSEQAQTLKRLEDTAADIPAFDDARVEAIRQAIAEGRYHIDPERLAERFIALESELNQ